MSQAKECKVGCCSGYKLNRTTRHCDKCPHGYTGVDCVYKCLFPYYGEDCYQMCKCSNDTCDFVSGCNDSSITVSSSTRDKTSQLATSQTASGGSQTTITERQPLEKSTKTGPAPTKSTFSKSASLLFYVTLALISVFVISFLIYIFSYLRKFVISKREIKSSDLQIKNTGDSLYECVDFRQHM